MIFLTKEEKTVLFFLASVLVAGTGLSYVIKKYPQLKNVVPFIETRQSYRKVNVNTATYDELLSLPYIGNYTATKILELRMQEGPLTSLDQIKAIKGIREKNFEIFSGYLSIK